MRLGQLHRLAVVELRLQLVQQADVGRAPEQALRLQRVRLAQKLDTLRTGRGRVRYRRYTATWGRDGSGTDDTLSRGETSRFRGSGADTSTDSGAWHTATRRQGRREAASSVFSVGYTVRQTCRRYCFYRGATDNAQMTDAVIHMHIRWCNTQVHERHRKGTDDWLQSVRFFGHFSCRSLSHRLTQAVAEHFRRDSRDYQAPKARLTDFGSLQAQRKRNQPSH